jgi:hypothetical protein
MVFLGQGDYLMKKGKRRGKKKPLVQLILPVKSVEPESTGSDVARLLRQIDAEYQAAQWGLSGLAQGTAQHEFITKRMERIEDAREQLVQLVGEDQATELVVKQLVKTEKPKEDKGHE